MYQQQQGLLYVLGFVATRDQPTEVTLTVPEGVATDAGGAANAAARAVLAYQPAAASMGWVGAAGSAAFGGTMVLSFATGIMGGGVGIGALGFAGFVQTFYYSGTLPLTNMPPNYKSVSAAFGWASLATEPAVGSAVSAPTPSTTSQAEDTLYSKQASGAHDEPAAGLVERARLPPLLALPLISPRPALASAALPLPARPGGACAASGERQRPWQLQQHHRRCRQRSGSGGGRHWRQQRQQRCAGAGCAGPNQPCCEASMGRWRRQRL